MIKKISHTRQFPRASYPVYAFLLLLICTLSACRQIEPPVLQPENFPIEFGISSDFSVESKAVIDETNYTAHGFYALGSVSVDQVESRNVFAPDTEVTYVGTADNGTWTYSPVRYWQPASYFFAGVMPSSSDYTAILSGNQLTLDFNGDGFDLSASQADLMVAFDDMTVVSTSKAGPVDFGFTHQLAMVTIEGASIDPSSNGILVNEIIIYGNSARTDGDMVFTFSEGSITSDYDLTGTTTVDIPYQRISAPAGQSNIATAHDWQLISPDSNGPVYDVLVPSLLVFPEICSLSIIVRYTEDGVNKTRKGNLSAEWLAGHKYTYRFTLSTDISFSVEVASWGKPVSIGEEVPIV